MIDNTYILIELTRASTGTTLRVAREVENTESGIMFGLIREVSSMGDGWDGVAYKIDKKSFSVMNRDLP
jgi:hypothetical protein